MEKLIQWPCEQLGRMEAIKFQVIAYICSCHMLDRIKIHYNSLYGDTHQLQLVRARALTADGLADESGVGGHDDDDDDDDLEEEEAEDNGQGDLLARARFKSAGPGGEPPSGRQVRWGRVSDAHLKQRQELPWINEPDRAVFRDHELEWTGVPNYPKWFKLFRKFTTVVLSYAMAQHIIIDYFGPRLERWLNMQSGVHCILLGTFITSDSLAGLTAGIFAGAHIIWRCRMHLVYRPYRFTALQFLLMSRKDLELVYSRLKPMHVGEEAGQYLSSRPGIELTFEEAENLTGRQRFVLDTLCFKHEQPTRVIYLLRSNRTPESHSRLRHKLAKFTIINILVFLDGFACLSLAFLTIMGLDSRYVRVYHGCDPYLQQLHDTQQLGAWSMSFTPHKSVATLADMIENFVIWTECSLVVVLGSGMTIILNWDLKVFWRSIDAQVKRLLTITEYKLKSSSMTGHRRSVLSRSNILDAMVSELQGEIMDFFAQIRQVDTLITEALALQLGGWLLLATMYTYFTQVKSIELPVTALPLLIFIIVNVTWLAMVYLNLHQICCRTYTPICSLMAFDRSRRRLNFSIIIEMYVRKKTCYTLLGRYPFQPTSFLTIVGYSFSSFFLITGIFRERESRAIIQDIYKWASCKCPTV